MILKFDFGEFAADRHNNNLLLTGQSSKSYKSPMYWSMVLRRLRGPNETFADFYKRIEEEWSLTVTQHDGGITGVHIDESMFTMLLMKYPPKASSLPT